MDHLEVFFWGHPVRQVFADTEIPDVGIIAGAAGTERTARAERREKAERVEGVVELTVFGGLAMLGNWDYL